MLRNLEPYGATITIMVANPTAYLYKIDMSVDSDSSASPWTLSVASHTVKVRLAGVDIACRSWLFYPLGSCYAGDVTRV
jgi:hypothetical protein